MVAVVSGNGLGLFNSSLTQLGTALGGQAGIGQSRDSQYLNIATGNLSLTGWDESLFGRGLSTGLVRTYNSAGSFGEAGADGWQTGYERTVHLASGTLNTAGSIVERATADGGVQAFAWDAARNAYVLTAGDGAHDTITLSGTGVDARWLWTEGSSQTQETYAAGLTPTAAGRLERIVDLATGAGYELSYNTDNQLSTITGANGETLEFTYASATGPLVAVSTRERDAAGVLVLKGQVTYGYDAANRLSWVQTDLTPDVDTDNTWDSATLANNDGKRFRTSYTYADATSLRITNISSSDGVSVTYSYDGSGRVASITQGSASDGSAQTLTYTYNANATDVTDSAGRTWTYQYDGNGQLTAVLAPAVNGQRPVTSYSYDADGNVVRISQAGYAGAAATQDTVFAYDANGNVLLQRDLAGNTVERTYNAANRVLTEAVYTTPDADGLDPTFAGTTSLPAGALVTRYVYDATNLNQLRFVINAAGEVSEHQYYGTGPANGQQSLSRRFLSATYDISALSATQVPTLAQMTAWVAGKEGQTSRSDVAYDAQGRITQTVAYATVNSDGSGVLDAAASITTYTYDAQGLLRQKVAVVGASRTLGGIAPAGSTVTEYVYDGLGRLLGALTRDVATASNDDAGTLATSYAYLDAANQLQVTLDSGAVRIEARNRAGLLVSVSEANAVIGATVTRTTQNYYDASGRLRAVQDAGEANSYLFYDAAGRLSATVDATGAVTETRYDEIGRAVQTIGYATRVDTSTWLVDGVVTKDTLIVADTAPTLAATEVWVDSDAATDRNATRTYDAAGRLATETNATGLVTTYAYDGASRLLSTTVSQPNDATVSPRVTRYFHDATGRQVGTLDAAGYLTESLFDAGGRLVQTIRYATLTDSAFHSAGTLAELRPLVAAADQSTRYFYDARGQQLGVLNAEGTLTEFVTDEAGNQRAVKAYAKQLTGLTGTETFTALRSAALTGAPSEATRLTERSFNALGQVTTERRSTLDSTGVVLGEAIVTRYSYDDAGRLVRTESAAGTSEVRDNFARYDVFGQLIGELGGQQAADATATLAPGTLLTDPLSEAQLDALYSQFGTRHSYDLRGQRTESVDAQGNKKFYFYDSNGRSTFTVRGLANGGTKNALGEVTETRYSAFGQVTESLTYTGRIAIAGMQTRADVQSAINVLTFVAASDSRRQFGYDQRGLLTRVTDAEDVISNTSYTAFGQVAQEQRAVGTSAAVTIEHSYDQRGLEIGRAEGVGTALARNVSQTVDAFGRVTSATDARGNVRTFAYDRLGRQISRTQVVAGRTERWQASYDAFSQVVSQTDALGRTTTYAISDSTRSVIITTPELIVTASVHNRFGQTVTATDGNGASTTFTYDKNGALVSSTNALGESSTYDHDVRGLLTRTTDASGHLVDYTYDAAGRVLTRIEDPTGLALTTTTSYDGQGRTLTVTNPSGAVSTISYDREGRVLSQAHDPSGLNLRTNYTWDAAGRQLTVVEAAGTTVTRTTQYLYDELGRRTHQIAASGTLNLTTTFAYDANDNVVGSTDATGNLTRFAYDEANRLRFSVDALGGVTETAYDANGRVTMTRQYVKPISLSGLPTAASSDALSTLVSNDALDLITYRVYDRNGRVRATIDGLGDVALLTYDRANNVTESKRYAQAVTLTPELIARILAGTASAEDILGLPGNSAPIVATLIADQNAVREQAFTFTLAADTFTDANGDLLTYSYTELVGTATWLSFDAATRTFSGIPPASAQSVTLRLTATDPAGLSVSDDFVINLTDAVTNVAPVVANPVADQTAIREQAFSFTFADNTFADANGDTLTYSYVELVGTATWLSFDAATRTFSGMPPASAQNVTLRLTATDPAGLSVSDDFVLTLTDPVTNVAPVVANPIADQTAVRTQAFSFTVPANTFADANGDTLTYSYTKVGTSAWLNYDAATRIFSGNTPASTGADAITISYTATDPAGLSVTDTFVITLVAAGSNAAPVVANPIADQTAVREQAFTFTFPSTTFSDANGDTLTYSYTKLVGTAAWLSFNASTRTFSGTPGSTDGNVTIRLTATDPAGLSVSEDFDITLTTAGTNTAPVVANPIADQTAVRSQAFTFTVPANTFADANGDALNYSYTKVGTSAWLNYDAATRTFSGNTPASTGADTITISYTATDPAGLSVTDTFVITLVAAGSNAAPVVANPIADQTAVRSQPFTFTVPANTFSDANGDTLTYSYTKVGTSAWLNYDAATRTFSGNTPTSTGADTITIQYTATDPAGLSVTDTFVITLIAAGGQLSPQASRTQTTTAAAAESTLAPADATLAQSIGSSSPDQVISFAYDAAGRVLRQTDGTGAVTRYVHDAAGRTVYTIDPLGNYTRNWFDQAGRLTATRQFSTPLDPAGLSDASTVAQLDAMLVTSVADQGSYFVYDASGRVRYALDLAGTLTESTYDSTGRQVSSRTYVTAVAVDSVLANKLLASTAAGSLTAPADNDSADRVSYSIYNELGQVRMRVDGAGNVVTLTYDAAGRVITEKRSAQPANISTLRAGLKAGTTTIGQVNPPINATTPDMLVYHVYDAAGRLRYTINSLGHTSEMLYDAAGRQVSKRSYANAINLATQTALVTAMSAGTATPDGVAAALAADATRDSQSYVVFDGAGQSRFAVDALGAVVETRHDAAGRVTEELAYVTPIALSAADKLALSQGKYSATTLAAAVSAQEPSARKSQSVYDAAGRLVYSLTRSDATQAVVSERRYDASGRVIAQVTYGITLNYDPTRSQAQVADAIAAAQGDLASNQRLTRSVYDAAGHLRFSIDDAGAVTEQTYDALGQVTSTRLYATPIVITDPTADSVAAAVAGQAGVRQTSYTYDNAGRLKTVTDNLNQVESYSYDALGQRISRTDKLAKIWTTEFDAAGRVIKETSPAVGVASVDNAGLVTVATRAIVTRTAYDALGNVISRTEDATGAKPRVTQFQYDATGRQIRTILSDAGTLNPSTGVISATAQTVDTVVTYDALGRAVVQKDVLGNYSYKAYNVLGQLAFEVDAEGYVTGYLYNTYGEQSGLTRYANRLVTTGAQFTGWDAGEPITLAQAQAGAIDNSADRVLTNAYDMRGNKLSVSQKQITYYKTDGSSATGSPTTELTYDAYGQLVKESVLLEASVWADTYHYFDDLGRETMTVDAEGYVSTKQYDALGQMTMQVEYARAVDTSTLNTATAPALPVGGDATTGFDRVTRFTYDALGRKSSESIRRSFTQTSGTIGLSETVSVLGYDAADRLQTTTIDGVWTTTLNYDAFGRTISVQEAERDVLRANAEALLLGSTGTDLGSASIYERSSPYTALAYDAFGNVVRQIRYANGVRSGVATEDANRDQKTVTRYDWQGRAVMTIDAEGNKSYSSFDAADRATHQWHALRGATAAADAVVHQYFVYDKAGRQTETRSTRAVGAGTEVTERDQFAAYNAFGEITAQAMTLSDLGDASKSIRSTYDAAGRLIGSNRDSGTVRTFGYNLAGFQTREQRYVSQLNGSTAVTWLETYRQVSDRLGRVVQTILPSHTSDESVSTSVLRSFDRWGNVLVEIDPRGFITRNEYNEQNQKTRQIAPQVEVVGEDGLVRWQAPETHWMFDALGRLSATRDANGNVHQSIYNAGGQLIGSVDGTGALTKQGYDALGNARISQNAVGYLTWQAFDHAGRVTSQGDYLPDATGAVRESFKLQEFTLSQDGQRVIVADALGAQAKYNYDGVGQLVNSRTAMNVVMDYGYDLMGHKVRETNGLNVSQTWTYDIFGRVTDHADLSGIDYNYTYNADSGQLTNETSGWGANRTTAYYANGLVRQINEGPNFYLYQYDANGNRTYEETLTVDGGGLAIRQRSRSTYDSHNRLVRVIGEELNTTTGVPFKVILDVKYGYDAVGNRRVVVADSGYGEGVVAPTAPNLAPVVIGNPESRSVKTGVTTLIRMRPADIFQDPEQFALAYSATLSTGTWPAWLHFSTTELATTGELLFTVDPSAALGDKTIRLKATDASGLTSYVDFTITVVSNTGPVSTAGATPTLNLKTGVAFATDLPVASYFSDNDAGDVLAYSVASVSPAAAWLTNDASTPGSLRLSGTPTSAGTYTVTVRATDGSGASVTRTVNLVVAANAGPVVVTGTIPTQNAMIGRDFEFTRPLNQLFTDPNNDVLSVTATLSGGAPLPMWLNLQLLNDTNPPTLRLVAQVPSTETARTIAVVLTAKDPSGLSVSRTINLQLMADPGVLMLLNAIPNLTAAATGAVWSYVVPSNTFGTSNNVPPSFTVSGMPSWMSFNASTQTFSGTPGAAGSPSVTLTATAGSTSVSTTFTVTTANAPPRINTPIGDVLGMVGTAFSYIIPPTAFVDDNGSNLTYSATGMPTGMTFTPSSRKFAQATPVAGVYTITLNVSDGTLTTSTTFKIGISPAGNIAPKLITPLPDLTSDAGIISYAFPANSFSDSAGQTLSYSATGMPSWMTFDPITRTFYGEGMMAPKIFTITITAKDPWLMAVSDTFTVYLNENSGPRGGDTGTQRMAPRDSFASSTKMAIAEPESGTMSLMSLPANTLQQNWKVTAVTAATAYNIGNTSGTPVRNFQQSWYTYDAENRTKVFQGTLVGGKIMANVGFSYETLYDAVGNATVRLNTMSDGQLYINRTGYSLRGERVRQYGTQILGEATVGSLVMSATFDANGRLLETRNYFPAGYVENYVDDEGILYENRPVGGWLSGVDSYQYDADGRMTLQTSYGREPGRVTKTTQSGNSYQIVNWLNDDNFIGNAAVEKTDITVLNHLKAMVDYTVAGGGFDAAGNVKGYAYSQDATETTLGYTWTYTNTYLLRDGYLEDTIGGTGTGDYKATTSDSDYDAYGRRTVVKETTKLKDVPDLVNLRYFASDANGGILSRRDGYLKDGTTWKQAEELTSQLMNPVPSFISASVWSGYTKAQREAVVAQSKNQRFTYSNGQLIGGVSQAGSNLDARSRLTAYSNSDIGRSAVTVQSGDTLQSIAQRVYGNSSLWYVLASANAITDDSQLVAGTELVAPSVKVSKNDAGTFKPYDPNEIIGPTAPSLPHIPPPKACNKIAMLLMVVVAIVVSVYTFGAALAYFGPMLGAVGGAMAAGFVAGVASSVASQVVGKALGVVDHFSLRQAVGSGITSAITAGIGAKMGGLSIDEAGKIVGESATVGSLLKESQYAKAAMMAVGNASAGYVGSKLAGVKNTQFSWKSIASSAVTEIATAGIAIGMDTFASKGFGGTGKFEHDVETRMINGVVGLHVRRAFGFDDKIDYGRIAVDAFGNALGNAVVRGMQGGATPKPAAAENGTSASGFGGSEQFSMLDWSLNNGSTWFDDASGGGMGAVNLFPQTITASGQFSAPNAANASGAGPVAPVAGAPRTWPELAMMEFNSHPAYAGRVDVPSASMSYEEQLAWSAASREVHATLPEHSDVMGSLAEVASAQETAVAPATARPDYGDNVSMRGLAYIKAWDSLADYANGVGDNVQAWFDQTSVGQSIQGTWLHDSMLSHRTRLAHYDMADIKRAILPTNAEMAARGRPGTLGQNIVGYYMGGWNNAVRLANGALSLSPLNQMYGFFAGRPASISEIHIPDQMLAGASASEFVGTAATVAAPAARFSRAAPLTRVSSRPQWLQRLDAGNAFNAERATAYPHNEVYINKPGGGYTRLDSYNPSAGEIVSRKYTQLSEIQEQTALGYINEIPAKYAVGATIASVPSSGQLAGQLLRGQYVLEVPVQVLPVPPPVLTGANNAGVLIRDSYGRVY